MSLDHIFRAYDIRGRMDEELDEDVMERIGQALGTDIDARDTSRLVVGHDVRENSPAYAAAVAQGAASCGIDVERTGLVPYGAVLFHGWRTDTPTAYVTASHLAPAWNGVKFTHGTGVGYLADENMQIKTLFNEAAFAHGDGTVSDASVLDDYRDHITAQVDVAGINVMMDCGNGASSVAAPDVFDAAGIETDTMNDAPDGTFPNRDSDVTPESLRNLRETVSRGEYGCGVAYDGDADRVAIVDDDGTLLSAEQAAALVLDHILPAADGPVIANVECSRLIEDVAEQYGRDVVRVPVGHNHMIQALQAENGCLAVETSRHMAVPHILPVDDAIAASLGIMEAVSRLDRTLSDAVADYPSYVRDRIPFAVDEDRKFAIVEELQEAFSQEFDRTNTKDGVRVDLDEGWVLVRASNTSPKIRLTVEARDQDAFNALRDRFTDRIEAVL